MATPNNQDAAPLLAGYLDRKELARELRVTTRTLARWFWLRQGPPSVLLAGRRLYRRADVAAWIAERTEGAA